jgi:hypothetical protein
VKRRCRTACVNDGEQLVRVEDASMATPEKDLKPEFRLSGVVLDDTSLENASIDWDVPMVSYLLESGVVYSQ